MNLTEAEIARAETCSSPEEWEAFCRDVKYTRDGQYPEDWWPVMRLSGRMDRIFARWGETPELKISTDFMDRYKGALGDLAKE